MKVYSGKSVFGGIAIGRIRVYKKDEHQVKRMKVSDADEEITRYEEAKEKAIQELQDLYNKALKEVGEANAAIFEVHQMMLDDDYMRERAADIKDISERLLRILYGNFDTEIQEDEPVIIVADDLAPSETVQLDKDKVLSFVTVHGSLNSHTAILARTMAIPALVGVTLPLDESMDGKTGIVDGTNGKIYVDPDEDTLEQMERQMQEEQEKKKLLLTLKGKDNVTLDGQKLMLYANIGNIKDLATVLQNDAGRRVIIRTLDIGADKQCDYFDMESEENPALGYRAIRICLTRPEVFKTQLRALFRASAFGKIAIMYPMITSIKEIRKIREIVDEVKKELDKLETPYGNPEQGIMIETPAAAIISDELAKEVDFFSIGTNDLTQYTLAIDRQNTKLDEFYDPHHPAVLRMISMVVENAHKAGIWAGICGELGADQTLTREFLAMGVDELSVSPGSILPIRKIVLETNVGKYKAGKEC